MFIPFTVDIYNLSIQAILNTYIRSQIDMNQRELVLTPFNGGLAFFDTLDMHQAYPIYLVGFNPDTDQISQFEVDALLDRINIPLRIPMSWLVSVHRQFEGTIKLLVADDRVTLLSEETSPHALAS